MSKLEQSEISKFNQYAMTHNMGGAVSDFEQSFYIKHLKDFSGTVLDVGSGDGKYAQFFKKVSPQSEIVPTDISTVRMNRLYDQGFSGPVSSVCALPFRRRSFDRIFLMQVIEHIRNTDDAMRECARILKSDGICFVTTPNYPIKRVYDWLQVVRFGKLKRLFDDPTHCSKFSAVNLKRAASKYFQGVEIFPTFIAGEGRLPMIRDWREVRRSSMFFSHKLLAVCRSPLI